MKQSTRSTRKEARLKKQRIRSTIFIVIVIGVLGLAGFYIKSAFFRPPPAPLAGNVIDVSASMGGFDKTEIRVKVGQPVTIRLTSMDNSAHTDGGGKHQWAIDELALDMVAQPEGSNTVTFTPTKTGSYNYYCNICCGGRANPSMNGTLIVEG
ncbi:MAG: cupredoxin domain-containing protein [Chloroflexi bacterium]|nr:cupredoxin domain-containing protein [Chloroflexota bacterium]MBI1854715.1 cupredoxin domain-containing protein [Chloroflexota bacterium]MBI3339209.1 cupredoxin domain-containing protein [Chloroflexota bacterium]